MGALVSRALLGMAMAVDAVLRRQTGERSRAVKLVLALLAVRGLVGPTGSDG